MIVMDKLTFPVSIPLGEISVKVFMKRKLSLFNLNKILK